MPSTPTTMPTVTPDPRPEPPERPDDSECCRSGCDPCILDLYQQELAQYRERLREWEARHPSHRQ